MKANGIKPPLGTALSRVDHLVCAAPELEAAIDHIEALFGVRAVFGGSHPGRGTHNALLALGESCYLELLAPDPKQVNHHAPRWLGADDVHAPRLTTWAAKSHNLPQLIEHACRHDIDLGVLRDGSRTRADGTQLAWQLTQRQGLLADGLVPFFIDWGNSPHPAAAAPSGLTLLNLHAEHPEPERVTSMLHELGLDMQINHAPQPALVATIQSPKGTVTLR